MAKKRTYGTGGLYESHGSYYGRWRTLDGRQLHRLIGRVRPVGSKDGLTRAQAEPPSAACRTPRNAHPPHPRGGVPTVDDVTDSLRKEAAVRGLRRSYLEGCESMQRVHVSPRLGGKPVTEVTKAQSKRRRARCSQRPVAKDGA